MPRLLWWFVYMTKVRLIVFIAVLICLITRKLVNKGLMPLYFLATMATIVAIIYIGIFTFHDLDYEHPVLTIIVMIILNVIGSIGYVVMCYIFRKEDAQNAQADQDKICDGTDEGDVH